VTSGRRARVGAQAPRVITPPPGVRSRRLGARLSESESPAFSARRGRRADESGTDQSPIVYARGTGANVVDVDGNRYVDLTAGFGALLLGHRPPAVARAVAQQEKALWLALGDVYASEAKVLLTEAVAALFPEKGARVMLGLSGADAITAAMKTAMLATRKPNVVAFEGAYHGLSYAPLAACGLAPSFRSPFESQLARFVRFAPYPVDDLDRTMSVVRRDLRQGNVGAVLVEPILGRGGCIVPPEGFLLALRAACDEAGALLIADEIWTGLGRSGAWLASHDAGVTPDIVCLGKGMGGGIAISACVGREEVMRAWGAHGGGAIHTATHFGAPTACVAALATLAELRRARLPQRAHRVGERWRRELYVALGARGVKAVRGRGLMVGIELEGGAARALAVTRALLRAGYIVLTGGASGDVLTLTPPLNIDETLLEPFTQALAASL
jgi:4-aminobutyrate aminotransferase/(S)-3-amino-2-methylpropionate transaminase